MIGLKNVYDVKVQDAKFTQNDSKFISSFISDALILNAFNGVKALRIGKCTINDAGAEASAVMASLFKVARAKAADGTTFADGISGRKISFTESTIQNLQLLTVDAAQTEDLELHKKCLKRR